MCEKGGAFVEVFGSKQTTALADGSSEDRCIDESKIALVEEIPDRLLDLGSNPCDGALAGRAQPEVPVIEKEVDSMLFWLNRVIDGTRAVDL